MCEILPAKLHDTLAIATLLKQLGYESDEQSIGCAISLPEKESAVFIAKVDNQVVGFMSLIYFYYFPIQKYVCRITAIVVDESSRGTGVGKKLIELAKSKANENACIQLEVTTSLLRVQTQKYYESLGFKKASYRYILPLAS